VKSLKAEERISELEDRYFEIFQSDKRKEENKSEKMKRILKTSGTLNKQISIFSEC
jgi:hypothetical protein